MRKRGASLTALRLVLAAVVFRCVQFGMMRSSSRLFSTDFFFDFPLSPDKSKMDDARPLHLVTCETRHNSDALRRWTTSARRFKTNKHNQLLPDGRIVVQNICAGWGGRKWTNTMKTRRWLNFVSSPPPDGAVDNSIVIFTDSDALFNPYAFGASDVLRAYDEARNGRPVLVSGDPVCWIGKRCDGADLDRLYPSTTLMGSFCPQFINAGQVMGTAAALRTMLMWMLKFIETREPQGERVGSDQWVLAEFHAEHREYVNIDHASSVFRNTAVGKLDPNMYKHPNENGKTCGRHPSKIRKCGEAHIPYSGRVNVTSLSIEMDPVPGCLMSSTPFSLHEPGGDKSTLTDLQRFEEELNVAERERMERISLNL